MTSTLSAMGVGDRGEGDLSPFSSDDSGMTPGGVQKKYVGLLFDVINTTPSNILANADQFAEHAPYLDGVAIALRNVPVITPEGTVVTAQHNSIMHPTHRWTREAIKDQLPILKEIVKKPHLKESFLLFWQTPGDRKDRLAWDDDEAWANYAENMANVAWLAKEAGLKGLMLDPEEYKLAPQFIHKHVDPSYEVCARLARQRGREVFTRVFQEFPDAVIWSLWFFERFAWWMEGGRQQYPLNYCDDSAELSQHYYNGLLDAMTPQSWAVAGSEHYSGSSLDNAYIYDYIAASSYAMAFVAPENMRKFRSQFLFSNTHYLDMYTLGAKPSSRWYHGPVKGSRLEHMRLNFEQSLKVATEYVWIYGEGSGKLFNWRNGHYGKHKTWEEVSPGMTETIMLVKDPTGLAERRKAKLKAEGKLVNLAADLKPIVLNNPGTEREFYVPRHKNVKFNNLKSGHRYQLSVDSWISTMGKDPSRIYAAHVRYYWLKNGQRVSDEATQIPLPKEISPKARAASAFAVITVPENVDGIEVAASASLRLGEAAKFWGVSLLDTLEPAVSKKGKPSKWTYDATKNTLSDGNWTLSAQLDKKRNTLTVRGENEKTVGTGVLDLTNVKSDTGFAVDRLGKMRNVEALTGVIAPTVNSVIDGGFGGSKNVEELVLGSLHCPKWATSEASKRRAHLQMAGQMNMIKKAINGHIGHNISPEMRPQHPLAVKGVKPGELYAVGMSMKRRGGGYAYNNVRFRGNGTNVASRTQTIAMRQPRKDDVWRSGEVVVRVPEGADEIYFDVRAEVNAKTGHYEYKDFTVYKIGEPLPVWPAESLREGTFWKK